MKEILMRNWKFKMIALILSILAWIYVHSSPLAPPYYNLQGGVQERQVSLNVQYENLQPDMRLVEKTEAVELVLRQGVRPLASSDPLKATVDLSQIETGGNYYLEIEVELPEWMNLVTQTPKYAMILIEEVNE